MVMERPLVQATAWAAGVAISAQQAWATVQASPAAVATATGLATGLTIDPDPCICWVTYLLL